MDPFSMITTGISLFEGIFSAGNVRDQARTGISQIDKEMSQIRNQRKELEKFHDSRRGMLNDEYGHSVERTIDKIDLDLGDMNREADRASAGSGFAKSGTIDNRKRLTSQRRREGYFADRTSLFDKMQNDMLRGDTERDKDLGAMDQRLEGLGNQREVLDQQSNTKFLGIF